MVNRSLSLTVLLSTLFLMGCKPQYDVVLRNRSSDTIRDAFVSYERYSFGGGVRPPGDGSIESLVPFPLPKGEVVVSWETLDGTKYSKTIDVRSKLPRGFNEGDLIFTILDGGEVEFYYESWAEQDAERAREKAEWLESNPPVFAEGELEIASDEALGPPRTVGLAKLGHPELEATEGARSPSGSFVDFILVLYELADRIKRDGARYTAGDRVDVEGQTLCFGEGENGRLLVEPCAPLGSSS